MKDHVRKAMEKALIDIDGQLWGKTYVPDEFVEKFAEYLMQSRELSDDGIADVAMHCSDMDIYGNSKLDEVAFAKALLKKASEK